jgi:phosphoribosylanthranilate isomerase
MTLVKVCGITNLEDALAALAAGADMLGFNFYERSPRYVETAVAWRVIEHLPEGVECVGVFVNESSPEDVLEIARESGVSALQLHGDETPEFCRALEGFTTIKALRVGRDYVVEKAAAFRTDAVLLDAYAPDAFGGTGHTPASSSRAGSNPRTSPPPSTRSAPTPLTFAAASRPRPAAKVFN